MIKLFSVFLLVIFQPLNGQVTLQHRSQVPREYLLGPGDEITLHIADVEEITDKPLRIDPNGYIDLPLVGRIEAEGRTVDQFRTVVIEKMGKYVAKPDVSINITQSASQPVSVIGQVSNPGVHQLTGNKRLLEVLSMSGGLKPDAGPTVTVTRDPRFGGIASGHTRLDPSGYSTATFSLDELMASTNPMDNIEIRPNDVIAVPKAELIYVIGDVHKAGGFALSTHPSLSLLQVLALAEGLGPDNGASHARILRQLPGGDGVPQELPVNIPKIYAGKAKDIPLLPNDVLFVPHSGLKVTTRRAVETAVGITTGLLIYR